MVDGTQPHRMAMDGLGSASGRWPPVVLAAALLLHSPSETGAPVQVAATATSADVQQDPLELLAAGEDLDLATEADLEFYAWVELETADDGVG